MCEWAFGFFSFFLFRTFLVTLFVNHFKVGIHMCVYVWLHVLPFCICILNILLTLLLDFYILFVFKTLHLEIYCCRCCCYCCQKEKKSFKIFKVLLNKTKIFFCVSLYKPEKLEKLIQNITVLQAPWKTSTWSCWCWKNVVFILFLLFCFSQRKFSF